MDSGGCPERPRIDKERRRFRKGEKNNKKTISGKVEKVAGASFFYFFSRARFDRALAQMSSWAKTAPSMFHPFFGSKTCFSCLGKFLAFWINFRSKYGRFRIDGDSKFFRFWAPKNKKALLPKKG